MTRNWPPVRGSSSCPCRWLAWFPFFPGLCSCLPSLLVYLPGCWSSCLHGTRHCGIPHSAGWHYEVLCCEKSNSVFAPCQASGFSQDSVFPAAANDIAVCIIACGSFPRTQFKPLRHLACLTGIDQHHDLNKIQVWKWLGLGCHLCSLRFSWVEGIVVRYSGIHAYVLFWWESLAIVLILGVSPAARRRCMGSCMSMKWRLRDT